MSEQLIIAGAVARLRKIADELESGKIRPLTFERFKSSNSPSYMENNVEVMAEDRCVVDIGWMERLA